MSPAKTVVKCPAPTQVLGLDGSEEAAEEPAGDEDEARRAQSTRPAGR